MKRKNILIALGIALLLCFNNSCISQGLKKVNADSILMNIDKYHDTKVEIEGTIVHVCGFDGKKMKLITESGKIIKIVPKDSLDNFDKSFYKKRVKVQGVVKEYRIERKVIEKMEKEKKLLCHIDNTPCKDSAWVNYQIKEGNAESMSKEDIDKLRSIMIQNRKDYVSVITILSEKIEIIEETKK